MMFDIVPEINFLVPFVSSVLVIRNSYMHSFMQKLEY
jgi:hypothetical protein